MRLALCTGIYPRGLRSVKLILTFDICALLRTRRDSKGTCRVNDRCLCPENFIQAATSTDPGEKELRSWVADSCKQSFGAEYPASVGKEDVEWRSCTPGKPKEFGTTSCCALSEKDLETGFGTNDDCPSPVAGVAISEAGVSKVSNCEGCPAGKCMLAPAFRGTASLGKLQFELRVSARRRGSASAPG